MAGPKSTRGQVAKADDTKRGSSDSGGSAKAEPVPEGHPDREAARELVRRFLRDRQDIGWLDGTTITADEMPHVLEAVAFEFGRLNTRAEDLAGALSMFSTHGTFGKVKVDGQVIGEHASKALAAKRKARNQARYQAARKNPDAWLAQRLRKGDELGAKLNAGDRKELATTIAAGGATLDDVKDVLAKIERVSIDTVKLDIKGMRSTK